jgi:putative FmdB family regulatory protein
MPEYDYRCNECGRKVSLFYQTYAEFDAATHTCPHCGSTDLTRLISRVAVAKSEEARMDSLADPSAFAGLDSEDPRELGRAMRKMSRELGEDIPAEFDEVVGRLESGESPESIEKDLPDLGGDDFLD